MKQCLLVVVGLLVGMCVFVALLVAVGAAIWKSPKETVLTVSAAEKPTQAAMEELQFPFPIPNTTLKAWSLSLYEGEMLEVDTGTHVVDTAALEVENYGDREVLFVYIVLSAQEDEYHFIGTNLPAGSSSLLIEADGKSYKTDSWSNCSAWVRYSVDMEPDAVLSITEVDMDTLYVENTTEKTMEDVILYYKNYLPEESLYLGGVTYQTYIGTLLPGQSLEISPFRYVSGYSKIIKAVPH